MTTPIHSLIRTRTPGQPLLSTLALATAIAVSCTAANAADYYLAGDMATTADLNNAALYSSTSDGSGAAPGQMAGNDFFSNGKLVRFQTSNLANAGTFAGNSFTLNSSGQLKVSNAAGYTVENLIVAGAAGGLLANSGTANNVFNAGSLSIGNGAVLNLAHNGAVNSILDLRIGTLTGDGTISIGSAVVGIWSVTGHTLLLSATDATAFTGTIRWGSSSSQNVVLDFDSSFATAGSLVARNNDRINLNQDVTFASVTIAGTLLDNGTYSFADLKAQFGDVFVNGGSGSITVGAIPEPATIATLLGSMALIACVLKRRSKRSA